MSPEAQRIVILETCGWYIITDEEEPGLVWSLRAPNDTTLYPWRHHGADCWLDGPDCPNDLNAMHEAEKTLNDPMEYCRNLAAVVYAPLTNAHEANQLWQGWWFVHATAAQRAEAFLRTIGKWRE